MTIRSACQIVAIELGVLLALYLAEAAPTLASPSPYTETQSGSTECAPPGYVLASGPLVAADPDGSGYFAVETLVKDNPNWAHGPGLMIAAWPESVPWRTLNGLLGQRVEIVIRPLERPPVKVIRRDDRGRHR